MDGDLNQRAAPPVQLSPLVRYADHWAKSRPHSEAVIDRECRLDYARLGQLVESCSRAFLAAGIKPGDRIAMLTTPRVEFVISFLAMSRVGAVLVGLNPRHRLPELEYVVQDCDPKLLIAIDSFEQRDYRSEIQTLAAKSDLLCPPVVIEGEQPDLDFFSVLERRQVTDEEIARVTEQLTPASPICVVYTSGSTGPAKGALLSDHGLLGSHLRWVKHLGIGEIRIISDLPIDHIGGLERMLVALVQGGTTLLQRRFDPRAVLECIQRERATFWLGELTQWVKCAPLLEEYDLSSIEIAGYAGAPLPAEMLEQITAFAPLIFTGYGMTETSNAIILTDAQTPADAFTKQHVGRPIEGVMTRLVDPDGQPVAIGQEGLLEIRSDLVFLGYLNRPEATAEAFSPDGWFRTGDLFRQDPDGTFDFLGRADDMYKSGGYNIYPREIEGVLESHEMVGRVAVLGVPDEVYQAVGHAFVEPIPGGEQPRAEDLRAYCSERLANYKVPKRITVLAELPKLRNEKVDKLSLRLMTSEYGQLPE